MESKEKIEKLKRELDKAKESLEQQNFFVNWLEGAIKVEEIEGYGR